MMSRILAVTDSSPLAHQITAALGAKGYEVEVVTNGRLCMKSVRSNPPSAVVCDMQVGSMGGIAVSMELSLDHSVGKLPRIPVLLLLDRRADVFLARRSNVHGWVLKPLDPIRLADAVHALTAGGTYDDSTGKPEPRNVASASGDSL